MNATWSDIDQIWWILLWFPLFIRSSFGVASLWTSTPVNFPPLFPAPPPRRLKSEDHLLGPGASRPSPSPSVWVQPETKVQSFQRLYPSNQPTIHPCFTSKCWTNAIELHKWQATSSPDLSRQKRPFGSGCRVRRITLHRRIMFTLKPVASRRPCQTVLFSAGIVIKRLPCWKCYVF